MQTEEKSNEAKKLKQELKNHPQKSFAQCKLKQFGKCFTKKSNKSQC